MSALYLYSNPIPQEVNDYAYKNFNSVIGSLPEVEVAIKDQEIGNIYYGSGFEFNSIYYYSININDHIVALLSINKEQDGTYSWSLSKDFAEELDAIGKNTNQNNPARLKISNNVLYAITEDNIFSLCNNVFSDDVTDTSKHVVNLKTYCYKNCIVKSLKSRLADSKYLALDRSEIQSDRPWCVAYCVAQILRYKGYSSETANGIMSYFNPNVDYNGEPLRWDQAETYARRFGLYPSYFQGTMDEGNVQREICLGKPICLDCISTLGKNKTHAVVLRGYNNNNHTYSIWNPWYAYYTTMSANAKSFTGEGTGFTWANTMRGW